MSVNQDIRRALEKRLAAISGIPNIAWENVDFSPTTGTEYIRARYQPQTRRQTTRGDTGYKRHAGLFLVDVFEPESSAGPASGDLLADVIHAQYDPGDVIIEGSTRVHIEFSERKSGINDSPWYMIPITVSWFAYSTS